MKILTVTGYKPIEMNIFKPNDHKIDFIKAAIKKRLISLIEEGLEWILVSGQMGVEQWTAEVVLELKQIYDIKIGIIPPFEHMDKNWPEHYQNSFQELTQQVDFFKPIYQSEYKGPFQFKARDKWLINKSDACLVLVDEEYPGSTSFFLEELKKVNKESYYQVLMITPYDIEEVVREIMDENTEYGNND
ncbi:SLOG family protein [Aquibacillus albus]|uniref:Phage-like protein YoqJ n=1 Tax=Aquibacillus albus TaxID=1168171 RepID=A0ABS2MVE3_9BACI|nr:SLOG family protein [Aquibacillus albus]MBM7569869.1 putative phage-like protein YoqJ [Aquibacillus albus]